MRVGLREISREIGEEEVLEISAAYRYGLYLGEVQVVIGEDAEHALEGPGAVADGECDADLVAAGRYLKFI